MQKFRRSKWDCCWFVRVVMLVNGICVIVISGFLMEQTVTLLIRQKGQEELFKQVHSAPFKNSNWMKSAVPLVVSCSLGIFIGVLQSVSSFISLVLDCSSSRHLRRLGWLMWISCGMLIFTVSCLTFTLAIVLKAHQSRNLNDSASFWANYRAGSKEVTHNFEGHAFCSALALNSAFLLGSMAVVAAKVFRYRDDDEKQPHLLLAM